MMSIVALLPDLVATIGGLLYLYAQNRAQYRALGNLGLVLFAVGAFFILLMHSKHLP